jgi:hypothetical protein
VACGAEWHVGHFFCAECGDVCSDLVQPCKRTRLIFVIALRFKHSFCGKGRVRMVPSMPFSTDRASMPGLQEACPGGCRGQRRRRPMAQ